MCDDEYENLPTEVINILVSWNDDKDLYQEAKRIQKDLERVGWTCDYGLDGMVYNVRKKLKT